MESRSEGASRAQSQIEELAAQLASRRSVTLYAGGLIAVFVGVILAGISVRLWIDSAKLPFLFVPFALVAAGCLGGAAFAIVKARRLQLDERARFEQYLELRAKAGLDEINR